VLAVVSDRKLPLHSGSTVTGCQADVHAHSDYYPFRMLMEGRTGSAEGYRFGFNGKESDNEVYGPGHAVSYQYRVQDARLGRFLSVDPLAPKYPQHSPYAFSENRVIDAVELEGRLSHSFSLLAFPGGAKAETL
jgi:RHS repeat-associated protein